MRKPKISVFISIFLLGGILLSTGCETEQTSSKKNDAMTGYAQEYAKRQAELINQEQLKKNPISEVKVIEGNSTPPLNK